MKRIISVITFALLFALILCASVSAADDVIKNYMGDEDEISWKLYESGKLYIYGDADIPNFTQLESDWSAYDSKITSVVIEDGVTGIGKYAFYGLSKLKTVSIPDTVDSIGIGAFGKCTKLTEIVIDGDVESIPSECFTGCTLLETVELPEGLRYIRTEAFKNCKSLTDITIPSSVKSVGYNAFFGCSNLEAVVFLGDSPSTLGEDAFVASDDLTIYVKKTADGFDDNLWDDFNIEIDNAIKDDEEVENAGDINGDGKVNLVDKRILTYCLAGYKDYPLDDYEEIGDIDGDGKFTVLDVIVLSRYIDGWEDYELDGYGW